MDNFLVRQLNRALIYKASIVSAVFILSLKPVKTTYYILFCLSCQEKSFIHQNSKNMLMFQFQVIIDKVDSICHLIHDHQLHNCYWHSWAELRRLSISMSLPSPCPPCTYVRDKNDENQIIYLHTVRAQTMLCLCSCLKPFC